MGFKLRLAQNQDMDPGLSLTCCCGTHRGVSLEAAERWAEKFEDMEDEIPFKKGFRVKGFDIVLEARAFDEDEEHCEVTALITCQECNDTIELEINE